MNKSMGALLVRRALHKMVDRGEWGWVLVLQLQFVQVVYTTSVLKIRGSFLCIGSRQGSPQRNELRPGSPSSSSEGFETASDNNI